jgi:predicted nucleotidyltransferase
MTLVERVARLFEEQKIAFALIGASAIAARGIPRSTYDIDLLTVEKRVLEDQIWETIRAFANIEIRRGDMDDPLKGVVWLRPEKERPIDVVVGRWKWEQQVIERAELVQSATGYLPTVTTSDLILLKLAAGGGQDAWDIGRLLGVVPQNVIAEVEERLGDLQDDARTLWKRLRSEW